MRISFSITPRMIAMIVPFIVLAIYSIFTSSPENNETPIVYAQGCVTPTATATRTPTATSTPTATITPTATQSASTTFTFNGPGEKSINGTLSTTDARSDNNRGHNYYQDTYTLVLQQNADIAISVTSNIDTELYYMYAGGQHWNEQSMYHNGDCGGVMNPRLPCETEYYSQIAGTYLIEVTSYAPLMTGAYTLTVEVE